MKKIVSTIIIALALAATACKSTENCPAYSQTKTTTTQTVKI